jgi:hypothetical protein
LTRAIPYDEATSHDCWGVYIPAISLWLGVKFLKKEDAARHALLFARPTNTTKVYTEVQIVPASLPVAMEEWENEFIRLVEEIGLCIDDNKGSSQLRIELTAMRDFLTDTIDIVTNNTH